MAMGMGPQGSLTSGLGVAPFEAEDEVVSAINTTPLVDVMLVLLIIFLITIPVAIQTTPVQLPKERNQPTPDQTGKHQYCRQQGR